SRAALSVADQAEEDLLETDRLGAKLEDGPAVPPDHVARGARELGVILAFEHEAARRRLDREYARHGAERGGDLRWRSVRPRAGARGRDGLEGARGERTADDVGPRAARDALQAGDEVEVRPDAQVRIEGGVLREIADCPPAGERLAHHVVTGDAHLAAGRRED